MLACALGLGEVAALLEDHRAVHAADAGEDRERMPLGPPQRRLGPLGGALEVADVLTRADEAAVHLAGGVRAEPALDREQHRLVEVAHALGHLPGRDQDAALGLQRLGLEVGRAAARGRVAITSVASVERVGVPLLAVGRLRLAQQQRAVLDALGVAFERVAAPAAATRPRWPAAR